MKENMPPSPAMREMVTPEGVRIRVPIEESPATATTHQMSSTGKVGGSGATGGGNNPVTVKTLEHIFRGEANGKGKAVGFHYEGAQMEAPYGTKVIESTRSAPDAHGVYTAKVEVRGVSKQATSSFFPRNWSKAEVVQAVRESYAGKVQVGPKSNYFEGRSTSGIKIGMYLNSDGTIRTAFPLYKK